MKKFIVLFVVSTVVTISAFSQKALNSYSEIFIDNTGCTVLRTGGLINKGILKGLYLFGETVGVEKNWTWAAGASYSFGYKNTSFRILGKYNDKKDFYGWFLTMHDFQVPVINPIPTFLLDTDLGATIGIYVPIDVSKISKHLSCGLWGYKYIKNPKQGGLVSGATMVELDIMLTF